MPLSRGNQNGDISAEAKLLNISETNSPQNDKQSLTDNETQGESKQKKEVSIKENNEKKMHDWKLVPPDGGWGWLVLFGSTLVNILVPGTVKSFGVLFVEFLEVFSATPTAAAWIPALCYFLYSSLGPLSSILSLKYSYRTVTLVGGTCAAAGMMISFYANSVAYLYISYGILVGTGAGLAFPPTVYIVTSYFERLRGLANGLCISGSAIGSIILPPVLRVLLDFYGYRGAVLIMGGITLNVWVAALFYDPVEKHMKKVPLSDENEEDDYLEPEEQPLNKPKFLISTEENLSSLNQLSNNESYVDNSDMSTNTFIRSASSVAVQNYKNPGGRERKISAPASKGEMVRVFSGASLKNSLSGLNKLNSSSGLNNVNSLSGLNAVPESDDAMKITHSRMSSAKRRVPRRSPSTSSFQYVSTPYHGSTLTLQPETFASTFSLRGQTGKQAVDEPPSQAKKFFDISLLKDPIYLIILISNSTNAISYTNFIILLPTYALALGYDKNSGALLLSIVSALDLVGRIGGSALSDLPLIPKEWYFIGGLLVSGISLALMPFAETYGIISTYCAIFGLASGIYVGITAVIMADLLGTERLQSTYGISLFVNGIIQLIGPPLCGLWFETTHSYTSLFCTLGIVLIVGAAIWGFMPFVKKKEDKVSYLSEC